MDPNSWSKLNLLNGMISTASCIYRRQIEKMLSKIRFDCQTKFCLSIPSAQHLPAEGSAGSTLELLTSADIVSYESCFRAPHSDEGEKLC